MGKAKVIHWPKEIGGLFGYKIENILTKDKFGGVPTKVEIPPMEQAYAIESNKPER
jgi:hypothetical protein